MVTVIVFCQFHSDASIYDSLPKVGSHVIILDFSLGIVQSFVVQWLVFWLSPSGTVSAGQGQGSIPHYGDYFFFFHFVYVFKFRLLEGGYDATHRSYIHGTHATF